MAEVAATIVSLVSSGLKITIVLYQIGSQLGAAGKEAHRIATEISTFCTVLKTLSNILGKVEQSPYYANCKDVIYDMTAASVIMFDEILDAAEKVQKATLGGAKTVKGKLGWVFFQRPKLTTLRASIESYKSTLSLMMETISAAEKISRHVVSLTTNIVAEAERDSATLASLRLSQRLSIIELEKKGNRLSQQTEIELERSFTQMKLDDGNSAEDSPTDSAPFASEFISSIRAEISSLKQVDVKSVTEGEVQRKAADHGNKMAKLLEGDHERLSQRWSLMIPKSRQSYSSGYGVELLPEQPTVQNQDTRTTASVPSRPADDPKSQLPNGASSLEALKDKYSSLVPLMDLDYFKEISAVRQWYEVLSGAQRTITLYILSKLVNQKLVPFGLPPGKILIDKSQEVVNELVNELVKASMNCDFFDEMLAIVGWMDECSHQEQLYALHTFLQSLDVFSDLRRSA
jgi:hypothetical protein